MLKTGEKVIAIIIARGGSKSIPRKNVLPLHGKPLVAWPVDLAKSIPRIDRVVISTDDDEIMEIAKAHGAEAPFKRPAELATDEVTTLVVLQHSLGYLAEKENYKPDIVLLLYPTAPFLKKERVEEALDLFEQGGCNSVVSVVQDWGRFWQLDESTGTYRPLHPKERVNRQYYKPLYRENAAVYFNRYDVLMKQNKMVDEEHAAFLVMEEGESVDIDEPRDFKEAEQKKRAIIVLGGGLVNDGGAWRTTRYSDMGDAYGALGDNLRVLAAADAYAQSPDSVVVASGGYGQYMGMSGVPVVAQVIAGELASLGIPKDKLIQERESNNTYEQLLYAPDILKKLSISQVRFITNGWHIPRVKAFIRYREDLKRLYENVAITYVDADKAVSESRPDMTGEIERALASDPVQARIKREQEGVRRIKEGTYIFKKYGTS